MIALLRATDSNRLKFSSANLTTAIKSDTKLSKDDTSSFTAEILKNSVKKSTVEIVFKDVSAGEDIEIKRK